MLGLLALVCTAFALAPSPPHADAWRPRSKRLVDVAVPSDPTAQVAVWSASVTRSGLPTVLEGTSCEIAADIGVRETPFMEQVRVSCGGQLLYRSMPNPSAKRVLAQRFGKEPGTIVFEGEYDDDSVVLPRLRMGNPALVPAHADAGDPTARLQVGVGEEHGIDLRVSRTSAPLRARPLGTLAAAAFDRPARVVTASGKRLPPAGTMCRMQLMPTDATECDVTIECRPSSSWSERFPRVRCNATAAAAGAPLVIEDSFQRGGRFAALHFESVDRPFTLTARVPETWLLTLTLQGKVD